MSQLLNPFSRALISFACAALAACSGDDGGTSDTETTTSSTDAASSSSTASTSTSEGATTEGATTDASTGTTSAPTSAGETTDPDLMEAQMLCQELCNLQASCGLIDVDAQIACEMACAELSAVCSNQAEYNTAILGCVEMGGTCSDDDGAAVMACIAALPECTP